MNRVGVVLTQQAGEQRKLEHQPILQPDGAMGEGIEHAVEARDENLRAFLDRALVRQGR
jgi:hypothetical protein